MSSCNDVDALLDAIRQASRIQGGDRGKLAAMRRGFSETTSHYAWPHVAPYCDLTDKRQQAIWLTLAAAAATLVPKGLERANVGNMGAAMRTLALTGEAKRGSEQDKVLRSFEGRFRRLLTCRTVEELCRHLRRVIRAAEAKEKPVDLKKLFGDLQDWENRACRDVRVEWAQGYWGVPHGEEGAV